MNEKLNMFVKEKYSITEVKESEMSKRKRGDGGERSVKIYFAVCID